jgi:hypothetical protein
MQCGKDTIDAGEFGYGMSANAGRTVSPSSWRNGAGARSGAWPDQDRPALRLPSTGNVAEQRRRYRERQKAKRLFDHARATRQKAKASYYTLYSPDERYRAAWSPSDVSPGTKRIEGLVVGRTPSGNSVLKVTNFARYNGLWHLAHNEVFRLD